jgi:phosphoketolase
MCALNDLDRFHLVNDVIDRLPKLSASAAYANQAIHDKLIEHKEFIARRNAASGVRRLSSRLGASDRATR